MNRKFWLHLCYRLTAVVAWNWSQSRRITVSHRLTATADVGDIRAQVKNWFTVRWWNSRCERKSFVDTGNRFAGSLKHRTGPQGLNRSRDKKCGTGKWRTKSHGQKNPLQCDPSFSGHAFFYLLIFLVHDFLVISCSFNIPWGYHH